ncbi:hypothetical protein B0H10DRAFT_733479 [Mycena sp. CBHHK59/15]|nr:hypothetical protein B0H10DRAFT_733479 [Mycena sp. CBHHK59/15]
MTKTESALSELPLELIDTIAQYTPICDLLYLCRTNRRINGVCLRWICRTVAIHSPARLVAFCKTLISNVVCAKYVRTLLIHCYPQYILNVFYHLFRAALRNMESIESLEVSGSPELFSLFSGIHFPRLRDCSIPFSIDIVSFLQRHPKLTGLSLDPVPHDSVIDLSTLPPIHMPELQSFSGPEIVALSVIPRSRAASVLIFWDPRLMTNFLSVFETVAKSTIPVRELQNILVSWDTSLLSAVATCIPGLTSLSIRNVSSIHAPLEMEEFFEHIDETLGALQSLASLSIFQGALPNSVDTDDLAWEFQTVRRWGERAPALVACVLPSATRWVRIRANVWYPSGNSQSTEDMLARFRWFVTTVVAGAAVLPPEYTAVLEVIGGKEMVGAFKAAFEKEGVVPEFELAQKPAGIVMTFRPTE